MRAHVEHRGVKRKARGYTAEEVFEAGLTCKQFEELRLQWDPRRKTKYKENVEQLKSLTKKK